MFQPQGTKSDTIPQFDGLGEDDIIKLLEDSDDDVVKIEAESSDEEDVMVDQLDGAADDQKKEEAKTRLLVICKHAIPLYVLHTNLIAMQKYERWQAGCLSSPYLSSSYSS